MTNNTNTPLKAYQVSNSRLNDVNSSVKVRNSSLYSTNSSLGNNVAKQPTKCSKNTKSRPLLKGEKKWCNTGDYPFLSQFCKDIYSLAIRVVEPTHHQLNNTNRVNEYFTTADNKGYDNPTTKHSAAKPSRQPLAIFVSKTDLINTQQVTTATDKSITSNNRFTYATGHSDVSCDGMSEPNKTPLWGNKFRGLNAVVVIPFYPFFTIYNKHTKHSGGHYHA